MIASLALTLMLLASPPKEGPAYTDEEIEALLTPEVKLAIFYMHMEKQLDDMRKNMTLWTAQPISGPLNTMGQSHGNCAHTTLGDRVCFQVRAMNHPKYGPHLETWAFYEMGEPAKKQGIAFHPRFMPVLRFESDLPGVNFNAHVDMSAYIGKHPSLHNEADQGRFTWRIHVDKPKTFTTHKPARFYQLTHEKMLRIDVPLAHPEEGKRYIGPKDVDYRVNYVALSDLPELMQASYERALADFIARFGPPEMD